MKIGTLQQTLLEEIAAAVHSLSGPNTVDTPLPVAILCTQIKRQETTTELLAWAHENIRYLLSYLPVESLADCLTDYCSSEQLQRSGFLINPDSPYDFAPTQQAPVVLINTLSHTQLYNAPQSMQLYAAHYSAVELHNCAGIVGGHTRVTAIDCPNLRAWDFVKISTTGNTTGEVTDYTTVQAKGQSQIVANGCAEVYKKEEATVICQESVRLNASGTGSVQAKSPIAYLKHTEGKLSVVVNSPDSNEQVIRLATQQERRAFCRQIAIHPHMLHILPSCSETGGKSLDELKQWICAAAEQIDPSLVNTFRSATTTTELLDKLIPHLRNMILALEPFKVRHSFNHEQLAERQIFVNDFITPSHPLTGTFYVLCNQIIDQPADTTGYYYHYAQAHVEYGEAHMYGHSVAFGNRASVRCHENSLCYVTDGAAYLYDQSVGSLHGKSQGYSQDHARMYGYDHTQLSGYGSSSMLTFDEATVNGVGATAFAEATKAQPGHQLQLTSDPIQLERVRQEGLPESPTQLRNIKI